MLLLLACAAPPSDSGLPARGTPPVPAAPSSQPAAPASIEPIWPAHDRDLETLCSTLVNVSFPRQHPTTDAITATGAVRWSKREVMGAPMEVGTLEAPTADELAALGLTPPTHAAAVQSLHRLGAAEVYTWDLTSDADGYHPWLVLRSDVVVELPTVRLICRQGALERSDEPDPLWGAGCTPIQGSGDRWWACLSRS